MKPRIRLTEEQLRGVAEQKVLKHSWSRIGVSLGINRQIVQREFEEWEQRQATEELKAVRQEVAVAEFRNHLDLLSNLAAALSGHLEGLLVSWRQLTSGELFETVLQSTAPMNPHAEDDPLPIPRSERHRRHRRWLYEGLENHLRGSGWKRAVEAIEKARSAAARELLDVGREAHELMTRRNSQKLPNPGDADSFNRLTDVLVEVTWQGLRTLAEQYELPRELTAARWARMVTSLKESMGDITRVTPDGRGSFRLEVMDRVALAEIDEESAKTVKQWWLGLATTLLAGEASRKGAVWLKELTGHAQPVIDQLDDLRLRPVLLRTRCGLCPA